MQSKFDSALNFAKTNQNNIIRTRRLYQDFWIPYTNAMKIQDAKHAEELEVDITKELKAIQENLNKKEILTIDQMYDIACTFSKTSNYDKMSTKAPELKETIDRLISFFEKYKLPKKGNKKQGTCPIPEELQNILNNQINDTTHDSFLTLLKNKRKEKLFTKVKSFLDDEKKIEENFKIYNNFFKLCANAIHSKKVHTEKEISMIKNGVSKIEENVKKGHILAINEVYEIYYHTTLFNELFTDENVDEEIKDKVSSMSDRIYLGYFQHIKHGSPSIRIYREDYQKNDNEWIKFSIPKALQNILAANNSNTYEKACDNILTLIQEHKRYDAIYRSIHNKLNNSLKRGEKRANDGKAKNICEVIRSYAEEYFSQDSIPEPLEVKGLFGKTTVQYCRTKGRYTKNAHTQKYRFDLLVQTDANEYKGFLTNNLDWHAYSTWTKELSNNILHDQMKENKNIYTIKYGFQVMQNLLEYIPTNSIDPLDLLEPHKNKRNFHDKTFVQNAINTAIEHVINATNQKNIIAAIQKDMPPGIQRALNLLFAVSISETQRQSGASLKMLRACLRDITESKIDYMDTTINNSFCGNIEKWAKMVIAEPNGNKKFREIIRDLDELSNTYLVEKDNLSDSEQSNEVEKGKYFQIIKRRDSLDYDSYRDL